MFKYGDVVNGKKYFEFSCEEKHSFLILKFSNFKKADAEKFPLESYNGQLVINSDKLISERKSGISKAIKIVKYDLDNENNYLQVDTENNEKFIIIVAIDIKNLIQNEANINC
jgi:hypothetical protein